jgi:hypothetical protein
MVGDNMTAKCFDFDESVKKCPKAPISLKGMFRVKIHDDHAGTVGDSGWVPNVVTQYGVESLLSNIAITNPGTVTDFVKFPWLGTGGAVSYDDVDLPGYYAALVTSLINSSWSTSISSNKTDYSTLEFLATFSTGWNTDALTINNVGLYDSQEPGGLFYAGNSYTASAVATGQQVFMTYRILLGAQP